MKKQLTLYIIENCPYCKKAIKTLEKNKITYVKKIVATEKKAYYKTKNKHETFPQLVLIDDNGKHTLGGSDAVDTLVAALDAKKTLS